MVAMKRKFGIKNPKNKLILVGVVLLTLAVGAAFVYKSTKENQPAISPLPESQSQKSAETETVIRLAMMGDMLAHDSVNAQAKTADGYDYTPYFTKIKPLYENADLVFCNPETPVAGDTLGVSGYPTFNAPSAFARDLAKGAGCNVINLASNHQADKGQPGIDATRKVWSELNPLAYNGINSTADQQNAISYFTVKNVKFAFLSFADFSNAAPPNKYSINIYHDTELVKKLLTEARDNAQVVLVAAHWGKEDSSIVNSDQKAAAQLFTDNGASMIIGTGPHVDQAVTWLADSDGQKVPVWYSIGNMLSSQLGINGLTSGVAQCEIRLKDGKVSIENLTFAPTFMSYDWPAADKAAGKLTTRSNLILQPLSEAEAAIKSMFGANYSVAERRAYLEKALDAAAAGVTLKP